MMKTTSQIGSSTKDNKAHDSAGCTPGTYQPSFRFAFASRAIAINRMVPDCTKCKARPGHFP